MKKVEILCQNAIEQKIFPGISIAVSHRNEALLSLVAGRLTYAPWSPKVTPDTLYDLASLTKPLATATLFMALVSEGIANLHMTLDQFYNGLSEANRKISLMHLLSHSSGIPSYRPYFRMLAGCSSKEARVNVERLILSETLKFCPGANTLYSDLGYILAGFIVEKICGISFWQAFQSYVTEPARIKGFFRGGENDVRMYNVSPSEYCKYRNRIIAGETHDMNAWILGGLAGHAGLFASADTVAEMIDLLLAIKDGCANHEYISRDIAYSFMTPLHIGNCSRTCGFDTTAPSDSSAGHFFSDGSIGHLGFTGTSLWHDPSRHVTVVMLTNRTFPVSTKTSMKSIKRWRILIHDAIMQSL